MTGVKLLVREDGIYVENAASSREFIDELKKALDEIGSDGFNETDFLALVGKGESELVRVSDGLGENRDACVTFKKSELNPDLITATIVPPKGKGKHLNAEEIFHQLKDSGFADVSVNEEMIHNAVDRQASEKEEYSFTIGERAKPKITVSVNPDKMSASVTIKKYMEGQKIEPMDILKALDDAKVVQGILYDQIDIIATNNVSIESVEVASGNKPVDGTNGEIVYFFDARKEKRGPDIDPEGNADYHHMNLFENVREGTVLCKVLSAGNGESGYNVLGDEIPPKLGKDTTLPAGPNTDVDPHDPTKLIALISGCPKLVSGRVTVENVMNIKGDVGPNTGDVDFVGSVCITGGITDGFKVTAAGDVIINGPCESCSIESGGDVTLHRGLRAGDSAVIIAKGNVTAAFLEGAAVHAGGDIVVREYCYHCDINAGNTVQVLGKKGFITGGKVSAGHSIVAKRLGSPSCPKTEVIVDPDGEWRREYERTRKSRVKNTEEQEMESPPVNEEQNPETQQEETEVEEEGDPFVAVIHVVHPNVFVSVSRVKTIVKEELAEVKFIYKLGKVEMIPYEEKKKEG